MTDEQKSDQLSDLLSVLPDNMQYAIYHSMVAAGGMVNSVSPMTAAETETAKAMITILHQKFMFGDGR